MTNIQGAINKTLSVYAFLATQTGRVMEKQEKKLAQEQKAAEKAKQTKAEEKKAAQIDVVKEKPGTYKKKAETPGSDVQVAEHENMAQTLQQTLDTITGQESPKKKQYRTQAENALTDKRMENGDYYLNGWKIPANHPLMENIQNVMNKGENKDAGH